MTRYYVHYAAAADLLARPGLSAECQERLRSLRNGKVGVAFALIAGRLTAAFLSCPLGRRTGSYHHLPLSQADADALVPLSTRQALWEEAMDEYMALGLIGPEGDGMLTRPLTGRELCGDEDE